MRRASLVALLVFLPSAAMADIYMWRDDHGVKHYTNSKALVPAEAGASVVLEEPPHPAETAAVSAPRPAPVEPPERARPDEDAAYEQGAIAAAYAAGWQQGLSSAQQLRGNPAPAVQFNAPLAVVSGGGGGSGGFNGGYYDPNWLDYNYPSLVTTSFDNGRSRHLTLRMLMQDQFAIDREGPYMVVNRFPPLGPNLSTILPRGLPFFVRPGSQFVNRVLTH